MLGRLGAVYGVADLEAAHQVNVVDDLRCLLEKSIGSTIRAAMGGRT